MENCRHLSDSHKYKSLALDGVKSADKCIFIYWIHKDCRLATSHTSGTLRNFIYRPYIGQTKT